MKYAYTEKEGVRTARARLASVNASYKDLSQVCRNVRGMPTEMAIKFLEEAAEKKRAVRFFTHNAGMGHRRELGGKKGGYPIKAARLVLGLVKSAEANAAKLGLGETKIAHIMANKQDIFPRLSPKGRRIRHDYETAFVEVVLEEMQQKAEKQEKKKKGEKK
ncbi:MAG: 50S ribosomal protein L22 [Candidatus Micrarchaeota archaeon]|nr:50S ribosomal protein L22 [Candidatus Micrarchaeota archaeon]